MTTTAVEAPTRVTPPRRRRVWRGAALGAALVATGALIWFPSHDGQTPTGPETLAQVWPDAKPSDVPGPLSDGPAYSPVYFLDATTTIGTAPSPSGTDMRLLRRAADGSIRELRTLPISSTPQFEGFVRSGDTLAWAETSIDKGTTMWALDLTSDAPPRPLTDDTGDVVFFVSDYDLVIEGDRLHWAAVADTDTELRSVPLAGGPVTLRTEKGQWAQSRWPLLVSAGSGQIGPVEIRDPVAKRTTTVNSGAAELPTCGPTWCRVLMLDSSGPGRIDLMRPDGSDRRDVANGTATASLIDVAVLDRFEVLTQASPDDPLGTNQQLYLYDINGDRLVQVAPSVGLVQYRGGMLWWSTGADETTVWHALDLRTLS